MLRRHPDKAPEKPFLVSGIYLLMEAKAAQQLPTFKWSQMTQPVSLQRQ